MHKYLLKAKNIYKNQGLWVLIKKVCRATFNRTKRFFLFRKLNHNILYKDLWEEYEYLSNPVFQITENDIVLSKRVTDIPLPLKIRTANWLVPNFNHLNYGGIYTIFRFINKLQLEGVANRVIIYDNPSFDTNNLSSQLSYAFPSLKDVEVIVFDKEKQRIDDLPPCDLAFCTFWTSAYFLLKFNRTRRKYYFVQDYEPMFYTAGSVYAIAESTYRFGFKAIVNTPGLYSFLNKRYGMVGISFVPAVDHSIFYPPVSRNNKRIRVFFYTRPNNQRNAFNLTVMTIKKLIERHSKKIEIITAGSSFDEAAYGLKNKITNLGLISSWEKLGELYRSCDIGFVYMLSKHPSYQPFEYMASGMATVTNRNEDNLWLFKDGINCLLSEPSPLSVSEKISLLMEKSDLRGKIALNGIQSVKHTWDEQMSKVWDYISKN